MVHTLAQNYKIFGFFMQLYNNKAFGLTQRYLNMAQLIVFMYALKRISPPSPTFLSRRDTPDADSPAVLLSAIDC